MFLISKERIIWSTLYSLVKLCNFIGTVEAFTQIFFFPFIRACEELVKTLGFDWIMMFMEEHLHSTTVTAAMRILVVLLSNQSILIKFKEGLSGGGWLDQTDSVLTNKIGTVLGTVWKFSDGYILSVTVVSALIRWCCPSFSLELRVRFAKQKRATALQLTLHRYCYSSVLAFCLHKACIAELQLVSCHHQCIVK